MKKTKLEPEIKSFIASAVQEVLNDPDFGLELSDTAKERLNRVSSRKEKTVSASEIKGKYY